MDVEIDGRETAMDILNGHSRIYEHVITTLDKLGDDNVLCPLLVVKSRLLQEE